MTPTIPKDPSVRLSPRDMAFIDRRRKNLTAVRSARRLRAAEAVAVSVAVSVWLVVVLEVLL